MAQLEGRLLDVEDSPDAHVKVTPDYQLGIVNGLEPPEEEEGLATPTPSPTYASKNDGNDGTNRLKQQTSEMQDSGYEEEDYIVVDDEDSGLNYDNTEIVQDEVLKAFSGLDTFGTRDIFKKEVKDSQPPEPTGTDWSPSGSNLSGRDYGPECASVNGVTQFFDSIHALSIVAQDLEGETSLQSTSVQIGPAKNIQKQENRSADTGLVYSHPSIGRNDLITTMEPPKNDEHKADNANSETAPLGSSPISDESTEKDDENVQLRDIAQEPDHAPQQESSDIAQGQEEDFTAQPANNADDFASPVSQKGIMQTPPKVEQTIETPMPPKDEQTIETPMPPKVEQTIETPIEEDPEFATTRESFYDAVAPDNIRRSDVSQEAESGRQEESGRSDSDEVQFGPRPDNLVIPQETMKPVEEKTNTVEGRGDEGAEIASRKQAEELEAGEDEEKQISYDHKKNYTAKIYETSSSAAPLVMLAGGDEEEHKSYDHQKSYSEKIYETASSAAQVVASKLGYGAAEGQPHETNDVNEGSDKGRKGIVERAGGVVASMLGIKHQEEEDDQQQESPYDISEQEQAEEENEETVEPQFWDAEAENVEAVEAQRQ